MYDANRREFLKVALAGLAMGRSVIAAEEKSPSGIPMRPLGRTGEKVTIIALGGWHIGSVDDDQEAIAIVWNWPKSASAQCCSKLRLPFSSTDCSSHASP